jgi:histone-lysine N-methyltransferase SUV39H
MKSEVQSNEYIKTTENEYEVETIRNRKIINGETFYLLKWKGYEEKYNTWEPDSNLNCPELIKEYEKLKGNTNKRWRHHSIKKDQSIDIPEIKISNDTKKISLDIKKEKKNDKILIDLNNEKCDIKLKEDSRSTSKFKKLLNRINSNSNLKDTKKNFINKIKHEINEKNNSNEQSKIRKKRKSDEQDIKIKKIKSYSSKVNERKIKDENDRKDIFQVETKNKGKKEVIISIDSHNNNESEEKYKFNKAIYKKIFYKKLYKKNNDVTNDPVILKRVKRNMKKWLDILKDSQYDKISIYNDIDLEGPPENFKYIKSCEHGKDVPRPEDITDFIIGCDCIGTCENDILCSCSVRDNLDVPISFSYNKEGEVLITRSNIIHECNIKCFCGPDCPNRVIQKNDIKKLEIFKTKNKGWGVRAKEFIKKSTFVAEYTGEIIKTSRVSERIKKDPERSHYIFDIDILGDAEYSIDAYEKGNISHFINHSCDPNLEVYCAQCDYYEMNIFRIAFFCEKRY